jgi:hypothetical protein
MQWKNYIFDKPSTRELNRASNALRPILNFRPAFNGSGHTIQNCTGSYYIGPFASVFNKATFEIQVMKSDERLFVAIEADWSYVDGGRNGASAVYEVIGTGLKKK